MKITTIQLSKNTKQELEGIKIHKRESYNEVIKRIINEYRESEIDEDSLKETIEILSDAKAMKEIKMALNEMGGTPLEDFEKELKNV